MEVKIHGKSGSDTEASSHESEAEVSDTELSSIHAVTQSSDSLSLSLNTTSTSAPELPPIIEITTSTSSPTAPAISTTIAASPTWSTGSATTTAPRFPLPPWQTTTGLDFGRPSSALYVSSPTATPTSVMFETLTKFMKDEFSKLHARIDRAMSHRPAVTSLSSGVSRFDVQWMERIDERLEDLQIVVQTNTDQVAELKTQLESLKMPPATPKPEPSIMTNLTARLDQLSEQVQQSQKMIAAIQLPSPAEIVQKLQAMNLESKLTVTEISCQTTTTSATISTPAKVEYDIGATPNNKSVLPLLAQQSSACGPNPGLKIREGAYQRPLPENARFPPSSLLARRMARQELTEKEVSTLRASGAIPKGIRSKIQMVTFANSLPYSQTSPAPKYEVPLQPADAYKQFLSGLTSTPTPNSIAAATDSTPQVVIHNGIHFMDFKTFCQAIEKICVTVKPRVCHTELRESWTQTVTTQAQSLFISNACQNCRQRDHKIAECQLPWRPDMCHVCYQDQVTTATCFRPHDKNYKDYIRGRCQGCGIPAQLFDPHCNACNRRYPGYKDWISTKYTSEDIERFHRNHLRSIKKPE